MVRHDRYVIPQCKLTVPPASRQPRDIARGVPMSEKYRKLLSLRSNLKNEDADSLAAQPVCNANCETEAFGLLRFTVKVISLIALLLLIHLLWTSKGHARALQEPLRKFQYHVSIGKGLGQIPISYWRADGPILVCDKSPFLNTFPDISPYIPPNPGTSNTMCPLTTTFFLVSALGMTWGMSSSRPVAAL